MNFKSNSILNTKIQSDINRDKYKYTINSIVYNANWITYDMNKFISINGEIIYSKENLNGKLIILGSIKEIIKNAFKNCSKLKTVIIGNSITSIGNAAFKNCTNLKTIIIPNSVISIGDGAFAGCENLYSIIIGNSITSIGDWAFSGCYSLNSIIIPNSVISIGEGAFVGCENLYSITIPDSIETIGYGAFDDCHNLERVIIIYPPEKQPNKTTNLNFQRKFRTAIYNYKTDFIWEQ